MVSIDCLYGRLENPRVEKSLTTKFPLEQIPAFETKDDLMITESAATLLHITYKKKNSPLLDTTTNERSKSYQYLFFAESSISPIVVPTLMTYFGYGSYDKKVKTKVHELLGRSLNYLNVELKDKNYLVGNHLTLADINLHFYLELLYSLFVSSQG